MPERPGVVRRLEPLADGRTRITYRTEITGPAADQVGPELGPAITADFPDVLAALAMTSQVLRTLEAKGLIRREVDAADTRAKRLQVTDRGADLAVRAIAAVEAADAAFFTPVTDLSTLVKQLRTLGREANGGSRG